MSCKMKSVDSLITIKRFTDQAALLIVEFIIAQIKMHDTFILLQKIAYLGRTANTADLVPTYIQYLNY